MNKIKYYYLIGSIIIILAILGGIVFLAKSAKAEEQTSTTFPVDEAGIAAYVKVDNINDIDRNALAEAFKTIEKSGESYVIGKVPVTNKPHLYVGLDGWIVAYFLKEEHASKIAGGPKTTTLEEAIDYMCEKIGATCSTDIKYYDFEFPEANKLTLIVENGKSDSFYVTVPGTLYEASYRFQIIGPCYCSWWHPCVWPKTFTLSVDGNIVYEKSMGGEKSELLYEYLDPSSNFQAGITHYVAFGFGQDCPKSQFATVLIYKN